MRVMQKLFVFAVLFSLRQTSWAWTKLDHQILYEASVELASNDGGKDFKAAKTVLDRNKDRMLKAVIAPDVNGALLPLIVGHAHEAKLHCNFAGPGSKGTQEVAHKYYRRAIEKWRDGDMAGALFDLGCVLHLVQDASFSGHSNILFFKHLVKHSAFENWVERETAPNKHPKSLKKLFADGWVITSGGFYLKYPWRDSQKRSHWEGGGEAWIDVAAHLSYGLAQSSMSLDYDNCDFQGAARMQFVAAEQCGAGLLAYFFREVGIIPRPEAIAMALKQQGLYPTSSPNGVSRVFFHQIGGKSHIEIEANKGSAVWEFPDKDYLSFPSRIGRAFYLGNYFVALTDAAEGADWQHLFLLPAIPVADNWYNCPPNHPFFQYFFDTYDDLEKHFFQIITLP